MQIKEKEELKVFLDAKLKSLPPQIPESDRNKLNEIALTVTLLPKQIESHLAKVQEEVCMIVAEKIEVPITDFYFSISTQAFFFYLLRCYWI